MQIFDYLNKEGLLHLIRKIMGRDVDLTQAEYDALPESKNSDGKNYYIYDSDIAVTAEEVGFDGSASGSTAANSQQALDELFAADKKTNESLENINNNLGKFEKTTQNLSGISLLDTSFDSGFYYISSSSDYPDSINYGFLIVDKESINCRKLLWLPATTNEIYINTCQNGIWNGWAKVNTVSAEPSKHVLGEITSVAGGVMFDESPMNYKYIDVHVIQGYDSSVLYIPTTALYTNNEVGHNYYSISHAIPSKGQGTEGIIMLSASGIQIVEQLNSSGWDFQKIVVYGVK